MLRTCIALLVFATPAVAQFTYSIDQSIPVEVNGEFLKNPWAGGLNSAQFNTLDLNGDGDDDLVIFERASGRIVTFLNVNNSYEFEPDYARLFPAVVADWMLLRDFNCDGRKDLFTSDPFGVVVYVNVTPVGGKLKWRAFNSGLPLLTKGFSGNINLKVNVSDLPSISDVDGDGDLDVLNVLFVAPGTVEWHKNMSMENTGGCDSLQFVRVTKEYGNFRECSCGLFAFGEETCEDVIGGGRTQHVGGKNMLLIDLDNDGDQELLFSEETCNRLYTLTNTGTVDAPTFTGLGEYSFSTSSIPLFPAPYVEDVTFDGKQDLIISPNVYGRSYNNWLVEHSVFLFRNTGTSQAPVFTFVQDDLLQEDMIEVGDYSSPAFADFDGDGDDDMLVGFFAGEDFIGSIQFFDNTGSATMPAFRLSTTDFMGLSATFAFNYKPQVVDMDRDGKLDVAFTSTSLTNGLTSLHYLRNIADKGIAFSSSSWTDIEFFIGVTENISVVDVGLDGKMDFLVGTNTGALEYWENMDPAGGYANMVRSSTSYLGQANNTSDLNPSIAVGDLDADGYEDLAMGTHRGTITIFPDFRNYDPEFEAFDKIIYNSIVDSTISVNLGGRVRPAISNLFGSTKPALIIGNTSGGLQVLKNMEGEELPEEPNITVFPNPLPLGDTLKVMSDRAATMDVFSSIGQRMGETMSIPANRSYHVPILGIAPGMYIARFTIKGKYYSRRFILY